MGTYCYAMRSPKHVVEVTLSDCRIRKAAIAYYHHKPTSDGLLGGSFFGKRFRHDWERRANLQLASMDARWEGQEFPPLMIKVDKDLKEPRPGDGVFLCKRGSFYDGDEVLVGLVASVAKTKEGRKTSTHIRVDLTHPQNLPQE